VRCRENERDKFSDCIFLRCKNTRSAYTGQQSCCRVIYFLIDTIKLRMDKPPSTRRRNALIIIKSYVFILFILVELRPIFAMSNKLFIIMNRSLFINLYNEFFLIIIACSSKISIFAFCHSC
jgi:hypothetical protein